MIRLLDDLRFAIRHLARHPGFAAVAVLTLAIGIGSTSAIFSAVSAVLLRPLPYPSSDHLVSINTGRDAGVSYLDWLDFGHLRSFSGVAIYSTRPAILTGVGDPEEVEVAEVSPTLSSTLELKLTLGRPFAPSESRAMVAVISHALWATRFGMDQGILGRSISLDGQSYAVVGVLPSDAAFPDSKTQVWTPMAATIDQQPQVALSRGYHIFDCIARLGPTTDIGEARAELGTLFRRVIAGESGPDSLSALAQMDAGTSLDAGYQVEPLRDAIIGPNVQPALLLLFGAVVVVLLIACANVANLLFARAVSRKRETAIRQALGASRAQIVTQLLVESVLLSFAAGIVGMALSAWGLRVIVGLWPGALPRASEISIDGRVLVFTIALAVVTGLGFGLAPAWRLANGPLEGVLRDEAGSGGRSRRQAQSLLVVTEVALAFVLLIGAGLLVRSFVKLIGIDPGFDTTSVLAVRVRLNPAAYSSATRQSAFFNQVLERLQQDPQVLAAALSRTLPLAPGQRAEAFDPRSVQPSELPIMMAIGSSVTADYFEVLRVPLRRGRTFEVRDGPAAPRVAVINEALAQRLWPSQDPIGRVLPLDNLRNGIGRPAQVVGVVGDMRVRSVQDATPIPQVFTAAEQDTGLETMWIVLRSRTGRPLTLVGVVRSAVRALDPRQPISDAVTFSQVLARTMAARRLNTLLLAAFAILALGLAVVGIYSLTAYAVTQRTRELGIRLALGASGNAVVALLIREGLRRAFLGVAIGLAAAPLSARLLGASLYGIGPGDWGTYALIGILVTTIALVATYIPARHATSVDPVEALRHE